MTTDLESVAAMREKLLQITDYLAAHFPDTATPERLWSYLSRALREAVPLNLSPTWAEGLNDVLIDWHQLLFNDGARFHEVFNQRDRYTFQAQYAEMDGLQRANQLATGSPFLAQTRRMAQVLTAALEAEHCLLRLNPAWFVLYEDRIDMEWTALEWQSPRERLLKRYDLGWMHPALRNREVPNSFSWAAGVTHAYAYLLLHTLTRLPPAVNQQSLLNQIDRFRVYNSRLAPDLRDWLRQFLRLLPESKATPLDCWEALATCIRSQEDLHSNSIATAMHDVGGDSAYGRNKRNNQNEDAFFTLTLPGITLLALADGVSTAQVGTGGIASFTIKEVSTKQHDELLTQLKALVGRTDWEDAGWALIETFFAKCHQAVVDKINTYLPDPLQPVEGTMSSTLVVALVRGNQALIGHWGDSRAYRLSTRGAIRLTEDHNQELEALLNAVRQNVSYKCPEQGEGAPLTRVLGQCRYDDAAKCCKPVEQKISRDACVLAADEWLLLCSDGLLSGFTDDAEAAKEARLAELAQRFSTVSCRELARQLVRAADDERGDDNTTAVLLKLKA